MQSGLLSAFSFRVTLELAAPGRTGLPPPDLRGDVATSPLPASSPVSTPTRLGDGGFAECSGLDLEAETHDLSEGGANDVVVRRSGRVKLVPLVLKRGMLVPAGGTRVDTALWDWLHAMVETKPVPRYRGRVELLDGTTAQNPLVQWTFERGLPLKIAGAALNAKTGEIAIEELHIAHEGLRLEKA